MKWSLGLGHSLVIGHWSLVIILTLLLTFLPVLPSIEPLKLFGALTSDASVIAWTGTADVKNWSIPANWSENRLPGPDDIVLIAGETSEIIRIDIPVNVAGIEIRQDFTGLIGVQPDLDINVGSHGFLQKGGRFLARSGEINIIGPLTIEQSEFVAPAGNLTLMGDLSMDDSGIFAHNAGTVTMAGDNQNIAGSLTFNNFTKTATTRQTLSWQSGQTSTFDGDLTLKGADKKLLSIRASNPGEPLVLDPQGKTDFSYLDLKDTINLSVQNITCQACLDSGNNGGLTINQTEPAETAEDQTEDKDIAGEIGETEADDEGQTQLTPTPAITPNADVTTDTDDPGIIKTTQQGLGNLFRRFTGLFTDDSTNSPDNTAATVGQFDASGRPIEQIPAHELFHLKKTNYTPGETINLQLEMNVSDETVLVNPYEDEPTEILEEEEVGEVGEIIEEVEEIITADDETETSTSPEPTEPAENTDEQSAGISSLFRKLIPVAYAAITDPIEAITIKAYNPNGAVVDLPVELAIDQDTATITLPDQNSAIHPGKYKLEVTAVTTDKVFVATQDFTWGVLAFNLDQSTYQPNTTATLGFGVLDDRGHTLCDADLELIITNPQGHQTNLGTADGSITISQQCGNRTVTDQPDYSTTYQTTDSGEYNIHLIADTINGQRELTDTFTVAGNDSFIVKRRGSDESSPLAAMRLFPPVPYTMKIELTANENFTGQIIEPIPAGFAVSDISNNGEIMTPENQKTPSEEEVFGESSSTQNSGLSTNDQSSKPADFVKSTEEETQNTVEVGGIEPPDSWLTNPSLRQATPTADQSYHIIWPDISLQAGQTVTLSYVYDAPDESPQFYLLGPLALTRSNDQIPNPNDQLNTADSESLVIGHWSLGFSWSEPRPWQLAVDAAFDDAAIGNWNIGTTWGGGCSSSCTEGTDYPGTADTATIDSHTVTLTANQSVHDLTLATGGTLSASSYTLDVSGTWNNTGGTFTEGTGTVMFTSSSDETITSNSDDFNNVTITDGLIGYWKLDETAANSCTDGTNDACDSSGYGRDGSWENEAAASINTAPTNFTNDRSITIDGVDDYIDLGFFDVDKDGAATDGLTMSVWFKADDYGVSDARLLSKSTGTAEGDHWWMLSTVSSSGIKLRLRLKTVSTTTTLVGTTDITNYTGAWHHAAATYDGSNMYLYLDGIEDNSAAKTGNVAIDNTVGVNIGRNPDGYGEFDGSFDDVRIYNRALTSLEIAALAAGNQPATENTAASEFTLEDTLDIDGDFVLNSGELDTKDAEDNAVTVAGAWENNGGIYTPNDNTTTLDGSSGTHELQSGGQAFNNLTLATSGGTWELHDRLDIDGTYTQSNATLDTTTNNYNIHANDWNQSGGTFTDNDSTLTLDSASNQTIEFQDPLYILQVEDPTENGLVGYWKFDEGQGTTAYDSSGNSNNGTITDGGEDMRWTNPTDGLIGYWKLDETTANSCPGGTNDACDSSGNGFDGTWNGNIAASTTVADLNFTNPRSVDPDGDGDYIQVNNFADQVSSSAGTISFWMNASTDSDSNEYFYSSQGPNGHDPSIMWNSSNELRLYLDTTVSLGPTLSTNTWYHVTGTWDGTNQKLYVNGDLKDTDAQGTIAPTGYVCFLGYTNNCASESWNPDAILDDMRIYNRALSAAEVAQLSGGARIEQTTTTTFDNPHALEFDGVDDYVTIDSSASLQISDYLTITAWLKLDDITADGPIAQKRDLSVSTTDYNYGFWVEDPTDELFFQYYNGGYSSFAEASATDLPTGSWIHVAVVADEAADTVKFYRDGTETKEVANTGTMPSAGTAPVEIGAYSLSATTYNINGAIDDVRIYDRALSGPEIALIANGKYADGESDSGLVGYWKLDETAANSCTGGTNDSCDSSGNGNDGAWQANATASTTVADLNFTNPRSVTFDGTGDYIEVINESNFDFERTDPFSTSFWAKPDTSKTAHQSTVNKMTHGSGYPGWDTVINYGATADVSKIYIGIMNTNGSSCISLYTTSDTNVNDGNWHHYTMTYDGSSSASGVTLYEDGVSIALTTVYDNLTTSILTDEPVTIGARNGNQEYQGLLDDVRIYDRELSAAEVTALAGGQPVSTGNYTLDTSDLDIDNDIYLQSGVLDVSASGCSSASCDITLANDWNNFAGASGFTDQTGTVTLDGADQAINGTTTFYNFTKSDDSDNATDETLTFENGITFTIAKLLTLNGFDHEDRVNLISDSSGTQFTFDVTDDVQLVDFLDVKDSAASSNNIICARCTNSGGNDDGDSSPFWVFVERSRFRSLF